MQDYVWSGTGNVPSNDSTSFVLKRLKAIEVGVVAYHSQLTRDQKLRSAINRKRYTPKRPRLNVGNRVFTTPLLHIVTTIVSAP